MRALRVVVAVITWLAGLASAASGFGGVWTQGRCTGWLLVAHLATTPVFMLGVTFFVICRGGANRFMRGESELARLGKVAFWLVMLFSWGLMVSMLAAMTPLFGYSAQHWLAEAHEISGIGLLLAGSCFAVLALAAGRKAREGSS